MIPKKIHYVWFGNNKKSNFINSCILSWKEKMPDYEIIEWNEKNVDLEKLRRENRFFDECCRRKMYAYMADYVRLKVLYEHGGVYFDTDIQVVKSLDDLLKKQKFVIGLEKPNLCAAGVICAEKKHPLIKEVLAFYDNDIWDYHIFTIPAIITKCMNDYNFSDDVTVLEESYFYPFYFNEDFTFDCIKENTYTIHWWEASWTEKKYNIFLNTKHIKNPVLKQIICFKKLGGYYYKKIKRMLKK